MAIERDLELRAKAFSYYAVGMPEAAQDCLDQLNAPVQVPEAVQKAVEAIYGARLKAALRMVRHATSKTPRIIEAEKKVRDSGLGNELDTILQWDSRSQKGR